MHGRAGVCMAGGHVWQGACMAGCVHGGCAWQGGHAWWAAMHGGGMSGRYYGHGIRSMSGRYASYWNAFLYIFYILSL